MASLYESVVDVGNSINPLLERAVSLLVEGAVLSGMVTKTAAPGVASEMAKQAGAHGVNRTVMTLQVLDKATVYHQAADNKIALANICKTRGLVLALANQYDSAKAAFEDATRICEIVFGTNSEVTCDTVSCLGRSALGQNRAALALRNSSAVLVARCSISTEMAAWCLKAPRASYDCFCKQ